MKWTFLILMMVSIGLIYAGNMELVTYSDLRLRDGAVKHSVAIGTWRHSSSKAIITFSDTTISGNDGCNRYSASWSGNISNLNLGPVMATRMACEDLNGSDSVFQNMLAKAKSCKISGSKMTIFDASGKSIATFTKNSSLN